LSPLHSLLSSFFILLSSSLLYCRIACRRHEE
jgi:hypothetical protein